MIRKIYIFLILIILFLNISPAFAEKFIYDSKGKRSPFSEPGYVADEEISDGDIEALNLNLKVKGIIWDDNEPFAIINDKIVKKGDTISGAIIFDIQKDEVTLKIKDKKFVLKIKERKAIT